MPKTTALSDSHFRPERKFGYSELCNQPRISAISQQVFCSREITPDGLNLLTPIAIGQRLWSAYQWVHQHFLEKGSLSGANATTTIHDGRGNFITATLGTNPTFAVAYDKTGKMLCVTRLNSELHSPHYSAERMRIIHSGGKASPTRINGSGVGISRSLGRNTAVNSSNAKIDIHSIDQIIRASGITSPIATIQIITACAGVMDEKRTQSKADQEHYMASILHKIKKPGALQEDVLAQLIISQASTQSNNMLVGVQTVSSQLCILGTYTGNNLENPGLAKKIAAYASLKIAVWFFYYCSLPPEQYAEDECSVYSLPGDYEYDNARYIEQSSISDDLVFDRITPSTVTPTDLQEFIADYERSDAEYEQFRSQFTLGYDREANTSSSSSSATTLSTTALDDDAVPETTPTSTSTHKRKRSASPNFFTSEENSDDNTPPVASIATELVL